MPNLLDIEIMLKIQGLSLASSREAIKSALEQARFSAEDIDKIVDLIQKHNTPTPEKLQGLYKIQRSDCSLNPQEISSLLGIEVRITELEGKIGQKNYHPNAHHFVTILLTLILALGGLLAAMYHYKAGPFHPTSPHTFFE